MTRKDGPDRAESAVPATPRGAEDPDAHIGAVERDRPDDPQHSNANVPGLDDQGLPSDRDRICEDVIGANVDESQG